MVTVMDAPMLNERALPVARSLRRLCALAMATVAASAVDAVSTTFMPISDDSFSFFRLLLLNGFFVLVCWLLAWSGLMIERRHPFGNTKARYLWLLLYYGAGTVFMLRFTMVIANTLHGVLWDALYETFLESMTTGLRLIVEVACAVFLLVLLAALPRVIARLQLKGLFTARAADDCLWFAAVIWSFGALGGAFTDILWISDPFSSLLGDMFIVTGFVLMRIAVSRPRFERAPTLVIVLLEEDSSRALRRFITRFAGYWNLGPITLIAPAQCAPGYCGVHARIAARAGCLKDLFPHSDIDLHRARRAQPPAQACRALGVRESYPALPVWGACFQALITPSTWVVIAAESHDLVTSARALQRLDAIRSLLPLARTFALTGEHVPLTLRGLRIMRLAALGRDKPRPSAQELLESVYRHEGRPMPEAPDWPASQLWAPLSASGLAVCLGFLAFAFWGHSQGVRASTWVTALLVALNHCIATLLAILPKRYFQFARRDYWSGRPKSVYLLSAVLAFLVLLCVSLMSYAIRTRLATAPMLPFLASAKWLLLSVTLTATLSYMCDDYVLERDDPRWLRPLECVVLACAMAFAGWIVMKWIAPDLAHIRRTPTTTRWAPVLLSAYIGAVFGFIWPAWYRKNLRVGVEHVEPGQAPRRRQKLAVEPRTIV